MTFSNNSPTSDFLTIPSKPLSPISYTFFPSTSTTSTDPNHLIVFLNGLGLPASSWLPTSSLLLSANASCPPVLTYDRFGQGLTTARDPVDKIKENGHDFMDVVDGLSEIINKVVEIHLIQEQGADRETLQLLLVGASIGAPIARLFAQENKGMVAGMILLDSNIANVNYSDFWPDPDAPDFDPASVVSEDCTFEQYKVERMKLTSMFDLNVKNAEGLDRSTSPALLPYSDGPLLVGPDGRGPELTVVGHDPVTFAEMSFESMGTPRSLSERITNPYWAKYNEGLTHITDSGKCDGVVIAKGCGHFIQRDDPNFVAEEVAKMLKRLSW